MIVKLLTEHHLEFLSFKGGCGGSSESTLVKNATLLEITCHGSNAIKIHLPGQTSTEYLVTIFISRYRVPFV